MVFDIIRSLKLKPAASEESAPLPPLSFTFPLANPEVGIGGGTSSTKPESCRSIDSMQQSFAHTIYIGSICVVTAIITRQLIPWYQNNVLRWSFVTRFFTGTRDWGNLPLEMAGEIGKRMATQCDIASFRRVCKQWRLSLPYPTRFPLCLPLPPGCDPKFCYNFYAISEITFYHCWWERPFMQVDHGRIFRLTFKLSFCGKTADYKEASILGSPEANYSELSFFAKAYYPCMTFDSPTMRIERECWLPKKLVLISSPNANGVNPSYASLSDLSVVVHLGGKGRLKGRLALLRLGGSTPNWVWDTDFCSEVFVNIATYKGQLCALDHLGRVFLMDYNSLQLTQLCAPPIPSELEQKSLYESCGDLYLVDFKISKNGPAEAYKLSLRLQKWLRVENLCDELFATVSHFLL